VDVQPLTGKALEVLRHPSSSIEAYEGAVRSSKTITALIDWLRFIRTGPAGPLAMVGRTERTVINNMILPLQEMLGPDRVRINYGSGTVSVLGREIHLFGANNEQSRTKIQGLTLAGAMVDEAGVIVESFFNMLYSRLSVPGAKLWLTANPEGPRHWLKVKWLDRAKLWITKDGQIVTNDDSDALDLHRYTFVLDDNPSLDPVYVERIKRSYTGMWHRRYVDAEWVQADGAIWETWDERRFVVPSGEIPAPERVISMGVDFGTRNATAGLLLGIAQGRLWVLDEWHPAHGLAPAQYSADLQRWLANRPHPEWIYVDPAAKDFREQLFYDGLMNVTAATNDVTPGIRTVSSLFAEDRLRVSDACTELIREIPGYIWDPKAAERGVDAPVKVDDHFADALRYAVHSSSFSWRVLIPSVPSLDVDG
jgi:PBSX family phage terminase large subunit